MVLMKAEKLEKKAVVSSGKLLAVLKEMKWEY